MIDAKLLLSGVTIRKEGLVCQGDFITTSGTEPDIREEIPPIVIGYPPPGLDRRIIGIETTDIDLDLPTSPGNTVRPRTHLVRSRHRHNTRMTAPSGMVHLVSVNPRRPIDVHPAPLLPRDVINKDVAVRGVKNPESVSV